MKRITAFFSAFLIFSPLAATAETMACPIFGVREVSTQNLAIYHPPRAKPGPEHVALIFDGPISQPVPMAQIKLASLTYAGGFEQTEPYSEDMSEASVPEHILAAIPMPAGFVQGAATSSDLAQKAPQRDAVPQGAVTPVPLPGSLPLFLAGLGMLFVLERRRARQAG